MNTKKYNKSFEKFRKAFPDAFINMNEELIVNRKYNIYFILSNVESDIDFDCKMIAWLSRPICKGLSNRNDAKSLLDKLNKYFNKNFSMEDMTSIYTEFGNDVNRETCRRWIAKGMDINTLNDGEI